MLKNTIKMFQEKIDKHPDSIRKLNPLVENFTNDDR